MSQYRENSHAMILWRAQNGLCGLCVLEISLSITKGKEKLSVDHITPKSRGGTNELSNKMVAHAGCNTKRGNPETAPSQWAALMALKLKVDGAEP